MALNDNALIDIDYYAVMSESSLDLGERNIIEAMIEAVSSEFEKFCNRKLKARDYSYDSGDDSYDANLLHYCIFDAPPEYDFWFPTYPVNSITEFELSGTVISVADTDDYDASDGYLLYQKKGKLVYGQGFDYNYLRNIQIKWNGGYTAEHEEMADLQYLCFLAIKQYINAPDNEMLQSERIGNYTYKLMSPEFQRELRGLSPTVFENLMPYKKVAFG